MALAQFTVTFEDRGAAATMAALNAGMRDPSPVVQAMAASMRQHVKTQFALGGNPMWVPNRPNTVAGKGHSKPLHGRVRNRSGIKDATSVVTSQVGRQHHVTLHTSWLGRLHNEGRKGPWVIAPKRGGVLRFVVAGPSSRGGRSQAAGRSSRGGPTVAFAAWVVHPGYPARPFIPVLDDAWLQKHWRTPIREYLFGRVAGVAK